MSEEAGPNAWIGFEGRYLIRAWREFSHAVSFEVASIAATDTFGQIYFRTEDDEDTQDFAKAELVLSGSIRWDGCSNWDFHTSDCMAHFCGRKDATSIGRLMDRLYDLAPEFLPDVYDATLAA